MSPSDQRRRRLEVSIVNQTRSALRATGLGAWLAEAAPAAARGEVTIAFVSDARMRRLNRAFRGVDRATDVLSFPASDGPARRGGPLGDIVIAAGVARKQAIRVGHPIGTELRILALHGLLHLLGYDHDADNGQMARLETRLRRRGRLRAGLIERASGVQP